MDYSTLPSYCNLEFFRLYSPITEDDCLDDKAQWYLYKATEAIIQDITIPRIDEEASVDEETITVSNKYIADITGDSTVSLSDVKVYGWTDRDDPSTKTILTVSKVYDREGKIELSADASGYEAVTVDYSFYLKEIDLNKLDKACAFLATFLFGIREFGFIPDYLTDGPARYRFAVKPYMPFLHLYHQEIERVYPYSIIRKKIKKMKLLRKTM